MPDAFPSPNDRLAGTSLLVVGAIALLAGLIIRTTPPVWPPPSDFGLTFGGPIMTALGAVAIVAGGIYLARARRNANG